MRNAELTIVIEPAARPDLDQLTELVYQLLAQEADFTPDRAKQRAGLEAILDAPHVGQIFVARGGSSSGDSEPGGQVLGTVSLLFTISTAQGGPVCWLEDVIVRPDARGRGIGSQLIQHAIDYARTRGFTRITLQTDRTNAGAQRLYERHGFVRSDMTVMRLVW